MAGSISATDCVLRDFDYPEAPNFPPSVESQPAGLTPLNRVIDVNLSETPGEDGGVPIEVRFEAEVRDPDIDQPLEGRVYLDHNPDVPISGFRFEIDPIPADPDSSDPRRRRVPFGISRTDLGPGCHLVELLVSGQFQNLPSREPVETGDIGLGAWWIRAYDDANPVPDMRTCRANSN